MATLKSLVDETTNIKDELVECHTNLKNNLIAKGVECSDNDKISSLIDKVNNINPATKVCISDNVLLKMVSAETEYTSVISEHAIISSNVLTFCGSARFQYGVQPSSSNMSIIIKIQHVKSDETITILEKKFATTKLYTISFDITNISVGDLVQVSAATPAGSMGVRFTNLGIKGDIVK